MKKLFFIIIALALTFTIKAQWVDNPAQNTFLANTSADAGEVYMATSPNGNIYVQWSQFGPNSWSPTLQLIDPAGVPQWDANGIHPSYHQMASWSQGFAMAATSDNNVVTCFSTEAGQTIAIKINADGTYAWGEQGIILFGNNGNSRTELLAGDDGGVWALGTDYDSGNLYVRYIEADGTLNPMITISDAGGKLCMFGLFVPTNNGVFIVYEKETWAYTYYYEKELWVAGYNKNGEAISTPAQLMDPQIIGGSYSHYVVPDGLGGGYVYIWHPAIQSFNVYVFHFNAQGVSTIQDHNGVAVHDTDPNYFYLDANATVDPINHDLLITYIETDAQYQALCRVYVNRITTTGYRTWGNGNVVLDYGSNNSCSDLLIDAHPYGNMFSLIYNEQDYNNIIKAKGFDMDCNELWTTTMSSQAYPRAMCENTTGFQGAMNIVAWVDNTNNGAGGLYGQNIGWDGGMGDNITPPTPPAMCYPPTNFTGEAYYNPDTQISAAVFSWTAPVTDPLHYNLYYDETKDVIQIDGDVTSFYQEFEPGDYIFKLTAVYEDCESDYALTPNGDDYLLIEIQDHTSVSEVEFEEIVNVIEIYNVNGQRVNGTDIQSLNQGMYIIKGVTESGKVVIKKIVR